MSETPFLAKKVLDGLTAFQRETVEHVIGRFYGADRATRFLVADETGLGKTMVARGVIARAIEQLEHDPDVARIDVVYVCSNLDIAQQNLNALDVTGKLHRPIASRLTLLAKHSRHFSPLGGTFSKPVNLISFTPATSFEKGWQMGRAEERAMLYLLLEEPLALNGRRATAAARLLQGHVARLETFRDVIDRLGAELQGDIDEVVVTAFHDAASQAGLVARFDDLIETLGRRRSLSDDLRGEVRSLVGDMRSTLARVSVDVLEPDLVILDEFQRFRDLLDPSTETGELAHCLFDYPQARVLLLSATPFKPFTLAEEAQGGGDDHHASFMETVGFLAAPLDEPVADHIAGGLQRYRDAVISGRAAEADRTGLRAEMVKVMTRTERPRSLQEVKNVEVLRLVDDIPDGDLLGYSTMRQLAALVGGHFAIDYWKSAPYFVNFMDGYKLADQVKEALADPLLADDVSRALRRTQRLNRQTLSRFEDIDMGNSRLRQLAADTVGAGWWKLLWVPPSLAYLKPAGPFAQPFARNVTKRLIFSSWVATPSAVASLLSYAAEQRIVSSTTPTASTAEGRRGPRSRLSYSLASDGRPRRMTSLALFWPMPGLARAADPRAHCRTSGRPLTSNALSKAVSGSLDVTTRGRRLIGGTAGESSYWVECLARDDSWPDLHPQDIVFALAGEGVGSEDDDESHAGLERHVLEATTARERLREPIAADLVKVVAQLAAHSPGNVAYRALGRLRGPTGTVTDAGHWQAAAVLAAGLRSLFARPETALLLDGLMFNSLPYWQAVLRYCAWGNLQAVMDEYLHHLTESERFSVIDDDALRAVAKKAAAAISLRPARYEVFDPDEPSQPISFTGRFALRYGNRRQDQENARQPHVRQAFNSPFWPFVLATTSAGQEGVDFHWWSHAVMHWNTPANPVDFEQREGRVDRYDGHATRRNIAMRHREAILASADDNPWTAAYRLAQDEVTRFGEFAPHWVYPGPARIARHVAPYALSVDGPRLARIKRDVALYRLTFGQPRQEDMVELLAQQYHDEDPVRLEELRLDLRPPKVPEQLRAARANPPSHPNAADA